MRLNQLFKPLRSQIPATDFPNMQVKSWDQREDRYEETLKQFALLIC